MAESEYTNEFLEDGTKNPKYLSIEQIGERSNELAAGMEPNAPSAVAFLNRSKGTETGTARDWVKNPPKTQKEYNEVPVGTEFFDVGKNRNFTKK